MKSLKAAAVVVGSVIVAGAATPAFALDGTDLSTNGATGTVSTLANRADQRLADYQPEVLNPQNQGSVPSTVKGAKSALNQQQNRQLLGGLGLQR
jgi:hypothetical protein